MRVSGSICFTLVSLAGLGMAAVWPAPPAPAAEPPATPTVTIPAVVMGLPGGQRPLPILIGVAMPQGAEVSVTPVNLSAAPSTPLLLWTPPSELLGSFPLRFEGWAASSQPGQPVVERSPTLIGTVNEVKGGVTAVYHAEPGPYSIINETDDGHGHQTTTTTWHDGQGHEIGMTVLEAIDGGNGTITATTTTYDDQGHETDKTIVAKTDDGQGHRTTTTTTYDGQGHETGTTVEDEFGNDKFGTMTTTTTTDGQGHLVARTTVYVTDDGHGHRTKTTTDSDAQGNTTGKTIDDVISDGSGIRTTTTRTTYDGAGIKNGTTIIDETIDGKGATTKTTTFHGAHGQDMGKIVVAGTNDGQGHRTTTTTTYNGQGHETGKVILEEVDDGKGTTTRTTTTYDSQGDKTGMDVRTVPTEGGSGYTVASNAPLPADATGYLLGGILANDTPFGTVMFKDDTLLPGLWKGGVFQPLKLNDGFKGGDAQGSNQWGEIAGDQFVTPDGDHRATVWANGLPRPVGPAGTDSVASAVNDQHLVVGAYFDPGSNRFLASFFSSDGTVRPIPGVNSGPLNAAVAINNRDDVGGNSSTADGKHHLGWFFAEGSRTVVAPPAPFTDSQVTGLNGEGDAAVNLMSGLSPADGPTEAVVHDPNSLKTYLLPTPESYDSWANGITEDRTVFGYVASKQGVKYAAIWWYDGTTETYTLGYPVNQIDPSSGVYPLEIVSANNKGEFLAAAQDATGQNRVVVLKPR